MSELNRALGLPMLTFDGTGMILGAWLSFKSFSGHLPERKIWVVIFSNYGGLNEFILGEDLLKLTLSGEIH